MDPAGGFGSGKLAYLEGRFELRATLPTGPATVAGRRVMSAAEAVAELRHPAGGGQHNGATPLAITGVRFGSATFATDRGGRTLPAWILRFDGVANPAYLLAIPPADRWPRACMQLAVGPPTGATISGDDRTIAVTFIGGPPGTGPCDAEYVADVAQSDTAVLVSPRQLPAAKLQPGHGCTAVGYLRTLTVSLAAPLGNRVLIDSRGAPMPLH